MPPDQPTVFVVDDHPGMRRSLCFLIRSAGLAAEPFASAEEFLGAYDPSRPGCLVLDLQMPGMDGLQLLERMAANGDSRPIIILTGYADVPTAVRAMKAGAVDFLQKPFKQQELIERVRQSVGLDAEWRRWKGETRDVLARLGTLTPREHEVLDFVVAGRSTKEIAASLGLSAKTVELHRRNIMHKMEARTSVDLVRKVSACRRASGAVSG